MKWYKIIALALTIVLSACCERIEGGHRYIALLNKSKDPIGCQELWRIKITDADTIFQCNMVTNYIISPDSTFKFEAGSRKKKWEADFRSIPYIQFLIMDGNLFKQYMFSPCDTVRKYVPVLHVYRLTQSDLERLNWTVVYPLRGATQAVEQSVYNKKEKK